MRTDLSLRSILFGAEVMNMLLMIMDHRKKKVKYANFSHTWCDYACKCLPALPRLYICSAQSKNECSSKTIRCRVGIPTFLCDSGIVAVKFSKCVSDATVILNRAMTLPKVGIFGTNQKSNYISNNTKMLQINIIHPIRRYQWQSF